jgi:hypothetical protein
MESSMDILILIARDNCLVDLGLVWIQLSKIPFSSSFFEIVLISCRVTHHILCMINLQYLWIIRVETFYKKSHYIWWCCNYVIQFILIFMNKESNFVCSSIFFVLLGLGLPFHYDFAFLTLSTYLLAQ